MSNRLMPLPETLPVTQNQSLPPRTAPTFDANRALMERLFAHPASPTIREAKQNTKTPAQARYSYD